MGRQSASDFARALERLPDVLATALRESQSATACRSVPPDAPRSLPAIVEVANRAVSPPRFVQQPPVLPGFVGAGRGPARGPYRDPRPRLEEAEYSCSTATLRQLWILSECLEALARVLRSTRASMPISRPSTFAEKPQAACLGAADEILSLLAPLQAAPSPGADAANLLARAALDLRHIAGPAQGTPGDALTACVSVVRHFHGEAAHNVSTLIGGRSPQAALTPLGEQQAVLLGRYLRDYVGVRFHAIFSSPIERSKRTAILACQEMGVAESMIRYADELQELSQGQWERQPRARIYQRGVLEQMVAAQPDFRAPGGESQRQVEFRMVEFVSNILFVRQHLEALASTPSAPPSTTHHPASAPPSNLPTTPANGNSSTPASANSSSSNLSSSTGSAVNAQGGGAAADDVFRVAVFSHGTAIRCLVRGVLGSDPHLTHNIGIDNTSISLLRHTARKGWHLVKMNDTTHLILARGPLGQQDASS
ncbi:unnamed protein product [Closterium sp. NIES-65]|nr:unnamed protein product [Closterium sp. NIES-65]